MMAAIISLSFALAISMLLGVHTYILLTNSSTIEMGGLYTHNPFKKSTWQENVAQYFGTNWKTWLIPIDPVERLCDGMNYQLKPLYT